MASKNNFILVGTSICTVVCTTVLYEYMKSPRNDVNNLFE